MHIFVDGTVQANTEEHGDVPTVLLVVHYSGFTKLNLFVGISVKPSPCGHQGQVSNCTCVFILHKVVSRLDKYSTQTQKQCCSVTLLVSSQFFSQPLCKMLSGFGHSYGIVRGKMAAQSHANLTISILASIFPIYSKSESSRPLQDSLSA